MAIASTILSILALLDEVASEAPLVIAFIQNTVTTVEATGKSGTDKLTAVLNATESFLVALIPNYQGDITLFMSAVEALVNDLVAIYNAAGVFVHAVTGK